MCHESKKSWALEEGPKDRTACYSQMGTRKQSALRPLTLILWLFLLLTIAWAQLEARKEKGASVSLCCCCCCWVTSVVSDSVWPHRRQPTRLPRPWGSPGKSTGVGCHFFLQCMKVKSESEVAQSCPTLSVPMDCSPPGSSGHGIFQARALEWGGITFSDVSVQRVRKAGTT